MQEGTRYNRATISAAKTASASKANAHSDAAIKRPMEWSPRMPFHRAGQFVAGVSNQPFRCRGFGAALPGLTACHTDCVQYGKLRRNDRSSLAEGSADGCAIANFPVCECHVCLLSFVAFTPAWALSPPWPPRRWLASRNCNARHPRRRSVHEDRHRPTGFGSAGHRMPAVPPLRSYARPQPSS